MTLAVTDQPGRVFAVFVVSPILLRKGLLYRDAFILAFAVALFCWDLYWLLCKPPRRTDLTVGPGARGTANGTASSTWESSQHVMTHADRRAAGVGVETSVKLGSGSEVHG